MRGLTLVELLVGMAVGLLVLGIASHLFVSNLVGTRKLLNEARVQQELRTTMGLIVRDLHRSAYWRQALAASADAGALSNNPYAALMVHGGELYYSYNRDADSLNSLKPTTEQFGFRLSTSPRSIQMLVGGGWQSLTNPEVLQIAADGFSIGLTEGALDLGVPCPSPCTDADTAPHCPLMKVRSLHIAITGASKSDPSIRRTLVSQIHLRNDVLSGACPR